MPSYSIFTIADEIFQNEFEFNTGSSQFFYLSGWLESNIGQLNTKINTEFSVSNGVISPTGDFGTEEAAIYKQMYLRQFYNKKTRDVLRGTESLTDFISLREGDTSVVRTNKNELAKTYRSLANDAQEELDKMVSAYNLYQASPSQVLNYNSLYCTGNCSC